MSRIRVTPAALFLMLLSMARLHGAAPKEDGATAELKGLGAVQSVATDARSAVFVTSGDGRILELADRDVAVPLAATGEHVTGMAFDGVGNLYAAMDRAIWKITSWGETSVLATRCGSVPLVSPSRLAMGHDGRLYFTDRGASLVCRMDRRGSTSVFAAGLDNLTSIAVSAGAGEVYVASSGAGQVWKLTADGKKRSLFATLPGPGTVEGMALDQKGNLYAARNGAGVVAVLDPSGRLVRQYKVSGPAVTDIAFGGAGLDDLFISEATTGTLYKLRVPYRAQLFPWETDAPLRIVDPVDGAILNRHDGSEDAAGLRIKVRGVCRTGGTVRVNGGEIPVRNSRFETALLLRERDTRIRVEAAGGLSHEITVIRDRNSFPRYRVSVDDNILFFKDIARNAETYHSIFDNAFLAFWRDMHRKYGATVHFNIYYETDGFNLSQMPDKFRAEWRANADWIHLSFHARANDPDRPYLHASAAQIVADYRLVMREIERFAGPELSGPATTVHWGAVPREAMRALRAEGVRIVFGYFEGWPDAPLAGYYLPWAEWRYLSGRDYWKDMREDIVFVHHDVVLNLYPPAAIVERLNKIARDPHQSEILELMIHEQYFYPDYVNYEPDYRQRVECAIAWAAKQGYKPVLLSFE